MRYARTSLWSACLIATIGLCGCAHTIVVGPDMNRLTTEKNPPGGAVGYYISTDDRARSVKSGGGGGDSVQYTLYKDLEPALFRVLSNRFAQVYAVKSAQDRSYIQDKGIQFVFTPQFSTSSSSSSLFTWPPTDFMLTIHMSAVDRDGKAVWEADVTGNGQARFSEFKRDFGLAAERASEDAFAKLQVKLSEFRPAQ